MSTRTSEYLEAVDHLPEGASLLLQDVSWEEYEQLLEDLGDRPAVRVTYDEGRLEIMSPKSRKHEKHAEFIGALVSVLADELDVSVEASGSATWKRKRLKKGTEPDLAFHIATAERVIGKDDLDLEVDPPPDLVVEVEVTTPSISRLPIFAALGVPEVWRYLAKQKRIVMYELRQGQYVEIPASRSFPLLTGDALVLGIEECRSKGRTAALREFRRQLKGR